MTEPGLIARRVAKDESVATFEWHDLHFHVITRDPVSADQLQTIERMVRKVPSVGAFTFPPSSDPARRAAHRP